MKLSVKELRELMLTAGMENVPEGLLCPQCVDNEVSMSNATTQTLFGKMCESIPIMLNDALDVCGVENAYDAMIRALELQCEAMRTAKAIATGTVLAHDYHSGSEY